MVIEMFNFWYFFWLIVAAGATVGLYYFLRKKKPSTQKLVLFSFLLVGLIADILKMYIPPYSLDEARMLRDAWFVNICGANIALFPILFWFKKKSVKDYMFYIGVLSGLIALFYPQEALGRADCELDVIRFYYHHWMLLAIPLLCVLLKQHTLSWKRVFSAPIGLLLLMLFIILNQFFQAELGFIPIRGAVGYNHVIHEDYWAAFNDVNWKNSSYIYSPNSPDPIGEVFAIFCPAFFKTVPVGPFAGQTKYWPWFWMIFPVFIMVTPLAFGLSLIFDHKNFVKAVKNFTFRGLLNAILSPFRKMKAHIFADDPVPANALASAEQTPAEDPADAAVPAK